MPGGAQANLPVKGVVNEGESGDMKKSLLAVLLVLALAGCSKAATGSANHMPPTTAVVTTSQPPAFRYSEPRCHSNFRPL